MSQRQSVGETGKSRRFLVLAGWCALIGVPLALVAGAVAEIVIAPTSVVVAFVVTRDGYVTSLAPSYAPYAAAAVLPWLLSATAIWGVILPLLAYVRQQHMRLARLIAAAGGIVAALGGYGLAFVVTTILPLTRSYTAHFLDFVWSGLVVSLYAGAVAGYVSVIRTATWPDATATVRRLLPYLVFFACGLAVLLEGSVAALTVLGWI